MQKDCVIESALNKIQRSHCVGMCLYLFETGVCTLMSHTKFYFTARIHETNVYVGTRAPAAFAAKLKADKIFI